MQPYFFPYIGYFQLMQVVDTFVFFDDVQYIDRGWVNRNQIPVDGKPTWLTMPVRKASRSLPINRREYLLEEGVPALKRKLRAAYRVPQTAGTLAALEALLDFPDANVADFNVNLLCGIASWLGINSRFIRASGLMADDNGLRGEARIIELCRRLAADHYVNPIGGTGLYNPARFTDSGIKLSFLRTTVAPSLTMGGAIHFSIVDLLLKLGIQSCRGVLPRYELLDGLAK